MGGRHELSRVWSRARSRSSGAGCGAATTACNGPPRRVSGRGENCILHCRCSNKTDEPALGIPVNPAYQPPVTQPQQQPLYFSSGNPYQAGVIPPNAIVGDPMGIPVQQTMYRDTPAPFNCLHCGNTGLTVVKSKPSLAAFVACMMPMMLGVCFLCPSMDCLWHKYHHCPSCKEKVADFEKSDPCIVMDPPQWTQESFAIPG